MATPMTPEELQVFKDQVSILIAEGPEGAARSYINLHYDRLPEEVKADLALSIVRGAAAEAAQEEAALAALEERAAAALEGLEELREEVEREPEEEGSAS
jgi:hypothetical protein